MDSHGATGCKRTAHGDDLGTYNEMLNTTCAMSLAGGISLLDFFLYRCISAGRADLSTFMYLVLHGNAFARIDVSCTRAKKSSQADISVNSPL
jgi:hypothetical protein